MVKNSLFSLISQEENREFVEFQILNLTNKIRRLHFAFGIAQKKNYSSQKRSTYLVQFYIQITIILTYANETKKVLRKTTLPDETRFPGSGRLPNQQHRTV